MLGVDANYYARHRRSILQRLSSPGIPFYFLKIDIAGNATQGP
ncbi:hypothetical protein XH90_09055 [Bradyrhizobium sp. CCBAU 53338]|nr:hypothetical protein XH90_09055 [Bradyrhizobium sp. CCBAU 53338]